METQKIRSFRKLLRIFERLTVGQLKEDSCCHGVTLTQCHTILEIEELGRTTTVELSKRLRLDKSTLSRTIDGLVNINLIERVAHPNDRRFTLLTLTSKGEKVADRINHSNDAYYNEVFKNIETENHDEVIKDFEKLVLAIRSHHERFEKDKGCIPSSIKGGSAMSSKAYFERVADQWDEMRDGFFSEEVRETAYRVANIQRGKQAADIGAGTGFVTEGLIGRGLNVIAVDHSEAMLNQLKKKFQGVHCRRGGADNLPVADETVHYVFANMYLHHVDEPQGAIKEMTRILKKGGRLVITDLDEHNFEFLRKEHYDRWMGFKRRDIENWFNASGLNDVEVACVNQDCCADSCDGRSSARVSIFVASGTK